MSLLTQTELLALTDNIVLVDAELRIGENYAKLHMGEQDYIALCKNEGIKTIFFQYFYYSKEKYLIGDELLKQNSSNSLEYDYYHSWAKVRNAEIEAYDFTKPSRLIMAASIGALVITCDIEDPWLPEDFMFASEALRLFQEDHEDELLEFYDFDEEDGLLDEFQSVLLKDSKFRRCTNKESRRVFLQDFLRQKDHKRFFKLVKNERGRALKEYHMSLLVDQIYNDYRNRCYRAKITVGDILPEDF